MSSNWEEKFSYIATKMLAGFLTSYNLATQAIAVDGTNVYNIQSTGGAQCCINGVFIPVLAADAELLIADTEVTTAWAQGTEYSVDDEVVYGEGFYKCLQAHTADNNNVPGSNHSVWQALPNLAGKELADDFRMYIMVTAEADGTLGVWKASAPSAIGTEPTLKVPYFDPSVYCVVAFIDYANDAASATVTFGDTDGGVAFGTDGTFIQVLGPVFPHPDNVPQN